jgi:hypothetical protein
MAAGVALADETCAAHVLTDRDPVRATDARQELALGTTEHEPDIAVLREEVEVADASTANRAGQLGNVRGEHRRDASEPPLHLLNVDDIGIDESPMGLGGWSVVVLQDKDRCASPIGPPAVRRVCRGWGDGDARLGAGERCRRARGGAACGDEGESAEKGAQAQEARAGSAAQGIVGA